MQKKRSNVSLANKFHYIALAIDEMYVLRPDIKYRTDVIGVACQFSSNPKLKRIDFEGILDLPLSEIIRLSKEKIA